MAITDEIFYHTQIYHEWLRKTCIPLKTMFGATEIAIHFVDNSSLINIHTHSKWMEHCMEKQYFLTDPHITTPQKINLGMTIDAYHPNDKFVDGLLKDSHIYGIHHGIGYVRRTQNGYQAISLSSTIDNISMPNKIINNFKIIDYFMNYFEKEMLPIQKKLADLTIDLLNIKDKFDFEDNNIRTKERQLAVKFLKQIGTVDSSLANVSLSRKEKLCLRAYLNGKTAADTAKALFLSSRTVEGHMERIKDKFNCKRKKDLLNKKDILECLGIID